MLEVEWLAALASRIHREDEIRERRSGEALVGAGHGELELDGAPTRSAAVETRFNSLPWLG